MGGRPSLAKNIEDVVRALEALLIVFCPNSAAAGGIMDRNGHRRKEVGEGKGVSWEGAQTKGESHECELTKNMFFHSDLLQLCPRGEIKITELFPYKTVFKIKTCVAN